MTGSTSKKKVATATKKTDEDQEELDDPQEDMDEHKLDELDTVDAPFTVLLIGGNAAAIKQLANCDSVTNLGLRVQPDEKCA